MVHMLSIYAQTDPAHPVHKAEQKAHSLVLDRCDEERLEDEHQKLKIETDISYRWSYARPYPVEGYVMFHVC